jgi:hypothetical protein
MQEKFLNRREAIASIAAAAAVAVLPDSSIAAPAVALGNHDYRGVPQAQLDYAKTSSRWRMPAAFHSDPGALTFEFRDYQGKVLHQAAIPPGSAARKA